MKKRSSRGIIGYIVLLGTLLMIAVILNGGLGQTVNKRIEYPDLLNQISENNVGRVAIRGNSLVGVFTNGKTAVADADFPERSYDFETTIGEDFLDTVRQMEANRQGVSIDQITVDKLPFQIQYRAPAGNPQYMISGNGGSFIPQTPYSPGYTSPGYAAPANSTRYQNGFNAFGQMGREPQNTTQAEQFVRQMPLNGGGYVPPPVPVRRPPFRLSDTMLVLIGAILLILFVIAVPVMGSLPLKILFIALAAGFTVLLWIKPLTAENKRLCFTIVAAALCIATIVSFISGGTRNNADPTVTRPTGASISITDSISGTAKNSGLQVSGVEQTTAEPASTPALDEDTAYVQQRVLDFFNAWKSREFNTLVDMCTPSWRSKSENARTDLFNILSTRTPVKDIMFESISGTSADTSRQITLVADIDYNNGKDPVKQRINVMLRIILQEIGKVFLSALEKRRGKAPKIHGYQRVRIQDNTVRIVMDVTDCSIRERKNTVRLSNLYQVSGFIHLTDSAGHMAVPGNRVLQIICHHGSFCFRIPQPLQRCIHCGKSILAVIIIRVDHRKRLMDQIHCTYHGMYRSVRFGASFRRNKAVGKCVIFLIRVSNFHFLSNFITDHFPELRIHALADHKNNLVKTSFHRIID